MTNEDAAMALKRRSDRRLITAARGADSPAGSMAATPPGLLLRRWWDVVRGVGGEEARGLEREADVGRRHHGVVLRAGDVGVAEGVPEDDVGLFDRAVGLGPAAQAVATSALV